MEQEVVLVTGAGGWKSYLLYTSPKWCSIVETQVEQIAAQDFTPTNNEVETLLSSIVPGLQRAKSAPNVQVS